MSQNIHTFSFNPDWMKLTNEISQIDRFDASWATIEKREGQSLKQLKSIATTQSVGASTRIEGSKMTDDEVNVLIKNPKFEERDAQEVIGYYEALDAIFESFSEINISESWIKNLHKILLKHSKKDEWHNGNYKQQSNVVEATNSDGSKYVIFQTTEPGIATEEAMKQLVNWFNSDKETLPIIKIALFVYDFLSIHPFQDGNGRLSRLLTTLLLLRQGYSWIQYVSFEHEIENRKSEYYRELMQCQRQRPGEEVYSWVVFFLSCLRNIQNKLMDKLEKQGSLLQMSPKEKGIYTLIENYPGIKSSEIAQKSGIPLPTVKKLLSEMVKTKLLHKHGVGAGTNYIVNGIKENLMFSLTNKERKHEFIFSTRGSYIRIKKIILTPLFDWKRPEEWSSKLMRQGLQIQVTSKNNLNSSSQSSYYIGAYNNPYLFQPVFSLKNSINIPVDQWQGIIVDNSYPINVEIELCGSVQDFDFDVTVVYDAVL